MAIIFPRVLPPTPGNGIIRAELVGQSVVGSTLSPFTLQEQVQVGQGQRWQMGLSIPPMQRDEAEAWVTFLLSLNGKENKFLLGDFANKIPQGSGGGNPGVDGAHTSPVNTIATFGWTPSINGILLPGDYIQVGHNYLIKVNEFNDATWLKNECTSSTNTIVAPNGVTEAERVTPDGGATNAWIRQAITSGLPLIPNRTFIARVWLKAASGSFDITISVRNQGDTTRGTNTITVTTTWTEFFVSGTFVSGDTELRFFIGAGLTWVVAEGPIDMWGASLDDELTDQRLYKVLEQVNSDADGLAPITVWPNLRVPHEDASRIFTVNPVGTFRLASNTARWSVGRAQVYGIGLSAVEAIT